MSKDWLKAVATEVVDTEGRKIHVPTWPMVRDLDRRLRELESNGREAQQSQPERRVVTKYIVSHIESWRDLYHIPNDAIEKNSFGIMRVYEDVDKLREDFPDADYTEVNITISGDG